MSSSRSLPSVGFVAAVVSSLGARSWFVRRSLRSPSGFSLVAFVPASVPYLLVRSLVRRFTAALRPCPAGWSLSFAVSGVAGVPPAAVARLACCPVLLSPPRPLAAFPVVFSPPPSSPGSPAGGGGAA